MDEFEYTEYEVGVIDLCLIKGCTEYLYIQHSSAYIYALGCQIIRCDSSFTACKINISMYGVLETLI